jgi:hypothetical protein
MFQTHAVEKIKTHILCSITFPWNSYRWWDNAEKCGRTRQTTEDDILRRMRIAWWITKVTNTHSEYVILIVFARQHWLRERSSVFRFTFIVCLIDIRNDNIKEYSCSSTILKNNFHLRHGNSTTVVIYWIENFVILFFFLGTWILKYNVYF